MPTSRTRLGTWGEELVFVEVRTSHGGNYSAPEESLSKAKIRRLLNTCQNYLQNANGKCTGWRVHLVFIYLGPGRKVQRIQHLPHAIQL
jgi:Holliday junction resolvase-like predicted endonuclease